MTTTQLMAELGRLGIQLEPNGIRLRFSPKSAVTTDFADRMKAHKVELMLMLQNNARDAETVDPLADLIECKDPDGRMSLIHPNRDCDELKAIDPPDPCPECGSLWMWQSVLGTWRCQRCHPPQPADRLLNLANRLRQKQQKASNTTC